MPRRSVVLLALTAMAIGAVIGLVAERARRRLSVGSGEDTIPGGPVAEPAPSASPAPESVSAGGMAILRPVEQRVWTESEPFERVRETSGAKTTGAPVVALPRERISGATLLGVASAIGLVAIGLATWALVTRDNTKTVTVTRQSPQITEALAILASQASERFPLAHSVGRIVLVVGQGGRALLVLDKLGDAPSGKSYQAWVIPPGKKVPLSAAVFTGTEHVVPLQPIVSPGATVAVTLERAGGVPSPTHAPKLVAVRS